MESEIVIITFFVVGSTLILAFLFIAKKGKASFDVIRGQVIIEVDKLESAVIVKFA